MTTIQSGKSSYAIMANKAYASAVFVALLGPVFSALAPLCTRAKLDTHLYSSVTP
jgi:hypothetical protein